MKAKRFAVLTVCMLLAQAASLLPAPAAAADDGASDPLFGTLPDWVPRDFASAMAFRNAHGKSYAADGIICLVRPMAHFRKDDYRFTLDGSMTMVNTPASSLPVIYELEIPEKPDPEDAEAVSAYEAYCDSIGNTSHNYSFFEEYAGRKTQTAFEVELFRVLDGLELTVAWEEKDGEDFKTTEKFRFGNADGNVYESDVWGWVPDCPAEYMEFLEERGRASVFDNYIIYCADVNRITGETLSMTQESDEGCTIRQVLESDCTPFTLFPDDISVSSAVILYQPQPESDGMVYVNWTVGSDIPGAEPSDSTDGIFESVENGTIIYDHSEHKQQSIVMTFLDQDTGALLDTSSGRDVLMKMSGSGRPDDPYMTDTYTITSNPFRFDSDRVYVPVDEYFFYPGSNAGYYGEAQFEITGYTQYQSEITCKMKWHPGGDLDRDGEFTPADMKLLSKLLLGQKVEIGDWNAADYARDNKLDAADLAEMKRTYIRLHTKIEEPDTYSEEYNMFAVIGDNLNLYAGPGTDYMVIDTFKRDSAFFERGYNKGNDDWVYVKDGWIKTKCDNSDEPNILFMDYAFDKPVIYLYPEQETDVHVELELTSSELATTYPKYQNGWDVTASPDGTLLNKADGTHHRYLFWESINARTAFDLSQGFCVAGSETEQFLKKALTEMGLTESEMNEFIVYWLPRMERNPYNLITFQGEAYTESAKLHITPKPDSICRIFMAYLPLENAVEIAPQSLAHFERTGFAVVEWGGSELSAGTVTIR